MGFMANGYATEEFEVPPSLPPSLPLSPPTGPILLVYCHAYLPFMPPQLPFEPWHRGAGGP